MFGGPVCKHAGLQAQGWGSPWMSDIVQTADIARAGTAVPSSTTGRPAPRPPLSRTARNRWPGLVASAAAALEQRRLFVLLPFALIGGLVAALLAGAPPVPWQLATVAAALVAGLAAALVLGRGWRPALLALAFWVGVSLLSVHGALFGTPMLDRPVYGRFEARIDQIVSETGSRWRLIVSSIVPEGDARPVAVRRARIVVDGGPDVAPGDVIRAPIRFYPVPGPVVPGGHDTQFHAYFDGIGAYGSTTGAVEIVRRGGGGAARLVDAVRRGIAERIDAQLSPPAAGIARAIVNGDQSAVTDAAREVMATAGLAHVLSISGLHLTLVAGGIYFVLRLLLSLSHELSRRFSVRFLAAIGGIVAALGYFSISGGNVAAMRSTIMIVLVFGAILAGRRALTMRNVAIAAIVVVLCDPASVLRPSFQLSFAAVVALVGAYELMRHETRRQAGWLGTFWRYLAGIGVTSVIAGAATLLFSVYHFQQTSPLGLLGNLLVLPVVSFVMMPSAVAAVLAMPFGLEGGPLLATGWSIDRMLELGEVISAMSRGIDASPLLTPLALVLALLALAWFAFFANWYRLIAPALLLPAVALLALDQPPDVLIADTTQAIAYRADGGLRMLTGKPASFAVDVWRESYGEVIEAGPVRCDGVGCVASSPRGFTLALVRDPAGFYEDCGSVDLVVTRLRAPAGCPAPVVIDAADLARGGVHWLHWDPVRRAFEIRPAITGLGQPWRAAR